MLKGSATLNLPGLYSQVNLNRDSVCPPALPHQQNFLHSSLQRMCQGYDCELCALQVAPPYFQCMYNSKEFLLINMISLLSISQSQSQKSEGTKLWPKFLK